MSSLRCCYGPIAPSTYILSFVNEPFLFQVAIIALIPERSDGRFDAFPGTHIKPGKTRPEGIVIR